MGEIPKTEYVVISPSFPCSLTWTVADFASGQAPSSTMTGRMSRERSVWQRKNKLRKCGRVTLCERPGAVWTIFSYFFLLFTIM